MRHSLYMVYKKRAASFRLMLAKITEEYFTLFKCSPFCIGSLLRKLPIKNFFKSVSCSSLNQSTTTHTQTKLEGTQYQFFFFALRPSTLILLFQGHKYALIITIFLCKFFFFVFCFFCFSSLRYKRI